MANIFTFDDEDLSSSGHHSFDDTECGPETIDDNVAETDPELHERIQDLSISTEKPPTSATATDFTSTSSSTERLYEIAIDQPFRSTVALERAGIDKNYKVGLADFDALRVLGRGA